MHSLYLALCAREGLDVKFCYLFISVFLLELSFNFMELFRKSKKNKALAMQLALCSNDIKIYCGWRVTFKAT